jgi:hypothetical protein
VLGWSNGRLCSRVRSFEVIQISGRLGKSWDAVTDHVGVGDRGALIGSGGWHVIDVMLKRDVSPRDRLTGMSG